MDTFSKFDTVYNSIYTCIIVVQEKSLKIADILFETLGIKKNNFCTIFILIEFRKVNACR